MKKNWVFCLIFVLFLAGCTPEEILPTPSPAKLIDEYTLPTERGEYFAASGVCNTCHTNIMDAGGADVSFGTFWRGTMMANSSRDPYWQASVRGEVTSNPDYGEAIQDQCTTCHAPMARTARIFEGDASILLDDGFLNTENDLHVLSMDGVSCTLCHQIQSTNLGEEDSFDGRYVIDSTLPQGGRENYGPNQISEENAVMMQASSGYTPVEGKHIQTSEFCATCHTLYTPTIDDNGEISGRFPEQMPYIEWLASDYNGQESCQDCHMPEVTGEVVLSILGSPARSNVSRHSFAGGNTYGLYLLEVYRDEIGVRASPDQIKAAIHRAQVQLEEQTAQISIAQSGISESTLTFVLMVESQVGHKFPSGFPSRRAWIHVTVTDEGGIIIFESGKWDDRGEISGNQNDLDATAYESHYQVIENPDQVQIYEAIMADVDNAVTTTLLHGAVYLKDNRLLPAGFEKDTASEDIAVRGTAQNDPDFVGGQDRIQYRLNTGGVNGPFTITAELVYQSVGYRWADNLRKYNAPETQRFTRYYENVPNLPIIIANTTTQVDK